LPPCAPCRPKGTCESATGATARSIRLKYRQTCRPRNPDDRGRIVA
jgi:hypothetical protein